VRSIAISVSVCLSVHSRISKITRPNHRRTLLEISVWRSPPFLSLPFHNSS